MRKRELWTIVYIFLAIFLAMTGYFIYNVQFGAKAVVNDDHNTRKRELAKQVIRGSIYAADGTILAEEALNGEHQEIRNYPYGEIFAHVVGFSTRGTTGIENAADIDLLTSNAPVGEKLQKEMAGVRNTGDRVYTSLRPDLQMACYSALGPYNGAVTVMEAKTGRILAMVSKPDFDPNTVSANWAEISSDDDNSPLVNRATQGLYPPGSIFKIVTLHEYMRENPDTYTDYSYTCSGSITADDSTIECYHGSIHGREDLLTSFADSCNTSFTNIGLMLDIPKLSDTADRFLFGRVLPTDLAYSRSRFSLNSASGTKQIMQTAIGQGSTLVTPLHIALITQAIANDGMMMRAQEIVKKTNYQGTLIKEYQPEEYRRIMTAEEAEVLTEYMKEVCNTGTGKKLKGLSYTVAGKTGSAEFGNIKGQSHSWFTGFTDPDDPDIVVTVIAEGAGSGSEYAVPAAKRIFDAYYGVH
ncbi:MAG: penicillin-binding protein 2 [Lachnospiraceae bacterium]|nr:penicillin-binding protein 2 [Lachnospiraceae bacterium]